MSNNIANCVCGLPPTAVEQVREGRKQTTLQCLHCGIVVGGSRQALPTYWNKFVAERAVLELDKLYRIMHIANRLEEQCQVIMPGWADAVRDLRRNGLVRCFSDQSTIDMLKELEEVVEELISIGDAPKPVTRKSLQAMIKNMAAKLGKNNNVNDLENTP